MKSFSPGTIFADLDRNGKSLSLKIRRASKSMTDSNSSKINNLIITSHLVESISLSERCGQPFKQWFLHGLSVRYYEKNLTELQHLNNESQEFLTWFINKVESLLDLSTWRIPQSTDNDFRIIRFINRNIPRINSILLDIGSDLGIGDLLLSDFNQIFPDVTQKAINQDKFNLHFFICVFCGWCIQKITLNF